MASAPRVMPFGSVLAWITCLLAGVSAAGATAVSVILITLGATILADRMTLLVVMTCLNAAALLVFVVTAAIFLLQLHKRRIISRKHRTLALLFGTLMTLAGAGFSLVALGLQPWKYNSTGAAINVTIFRAIGLAFASTFLLTGLLFYSLSSSPSRPDEEAWKAEDAETTYTSELKESPKMRRGSQNYPPVSLSLANGRVVNRSATGQIFVKPMNFRTRLVSHESMQSIKTTRSEQTVSTREGDGFDTWEVDVDDHPGDHPRPFVSTALDPIPASTPPSPAKTLARVKTESPRHVTPSLSSADETDDEPTPRPVTRGKTLLTIRHTAPRESLIEAVSPMDTHFNAGASDSAVSPIEPDHHLERLTTRSPRPSCSEDDSPPTIRQASYIRYPPPLRPVASFHLPRPLPSPSTPNTALPSPALSTVSVNSTIFSTPLPTPQAPHPHSPRLLHHSQSLAALTGDQSHIHPLFRTTSLNKNPIPKITTPGTVVHASPWGGQTLSSPDEQNALGLSLAGGSRLSRTGPDLWPLPPAPRSPILLPSTASSTDLLHRAAQPQVRARPALVQRDVNVDTFPAAVVGLGISSSIKAAPDTTATHTVATLASSSPASKHSPRPALLRSTKSAAEISPTKSRARSHSNASGGSTSRPGSLTMPKANMPPLPSPAYFTPGGTPWSASPAGSGWSTPVLEPGVGERGLGTGMGQATLDFGMERVDRAGRVGFF